MPTVAWQALCLQGYSIPKHARDHSIGGGVVGRYVSARKDEAHPGLHFKQDAAERAAPLCCQGVHGVRLLVCNA